MAKRRILAGGLILFLLLRLLPGFAIFWQERISLPLLGAFRFIGDRLPFVLLEWMGIFAAFMLIISRFFKRFLQCLRSMVLFMFISYLAIWYPLYFTPQTIHKAAPAQTAALAGSIIDEFNAAPPDFSAMPQLPAKTARFPAWMRVFNVNGFCSFFTGEAIVSPELPASILPFIAVHERMHLEGAAGEGAANIAAWQSCMELGGSYAASARLWALRYGMGILRRTDPGLYSDCMQRMNSETWRIFRDCGGSYSPAEPSILHQALSRLLGIERQLLDYEILAFHLAAELRQ